MSERDELDAKLAAKWHDRDCGCADAECPIASASLERARTIGDTIGAALTGPCPLRWQVKFPESLICDLMDFQRRAGITVDGVLGPQTWVALAEENERK